MKRIASKGMSCELGERSSFKHMKQCDDNTLLLGKIGATFESETLLDLPRNEYTLSLTGLRPNQK